MDKNSRDIYIGPIKCNVLRRNCIRLHNSNIDEKPSRSAHTPPIRSPPPALQTCTYTCI